MMNNLASYEIVEGLVSEDRVFIGIVLGKVAVKITVNDCIYNSHRIFKLRYSVLFNNFVHNYRGQKVLIGLNKDSKDVIVIEKVI